MGLWRTVKLVERIWCFGGEFHLLNGYGALEERPYPINRSNSSKAPYPFNRFKCPPKRHIRLTGLTVFQSAVSVQQVQLSSKSPYPFNRFNCPSKHHVRLTGSTVLQSTKSVQQAGTLEHVKRIWRFGGQLNLLNGYGD
jgi:hypothetical protein